VRRVLTTVTLLGLLVATSAAFAITEHLKQIKSPIFGTEVPVKVFSPVCHCPTSTATVSFKLRHTGHATVTIVDSHGHEVRTIGSDVLMHARAPRQFVWDGRTDGGARAPDGIYHPWVQLPRHTYRFTNNIILDTQAPKVLSATTAKRRPVLFVGKGRSVAIRYSFSGKAHAVVYLGRRQIIVGRLIRPTAKIKWAGKLDHRPLPARTYVLSIGARDKAGNETPVAERKQVTVVLRYVEVTPGRVTVRSGRRFAVHVETAARRYTWRLGRRHGERRGKVLRLRAPTTPGTYRLVVAENGHVTTAVVKVRGK
jgi:hypothetical protein